MFKIKSKKKSILIIVTILSIYFNSTSVVFADTTDKTNLQSKLEQQEEQIKDDMGDKIVPKNNMNISDTADNIQNAEYGDLNVKKKTSAATEFINNFVIKSRTTVIIAYAVFVAIISFYMATIGSRSLNKRRLGLLLLKGNTILFLVFINIPLIIIYFSNFKLNVDSSSVYSRIMGVMNFFSENSFVISTLFIYLGISKLVVSKNDLPTRQQGIYLLKASVLLFMVFNLVPVAIRFIV